MSNLRQGLVGEYLFIGNAEDTSGFGRHGRVEGATLTEDRFGAANSAYAFSGQGDCIVLNPFPNLGTEAFSLSAWAKYDQEAALKGWNNAIVSQDDHGRVLDQSRRVFQLSTKGAYATWHRMRQSTDAVGKHPIQWGVWYHFVAIYDGTQHRLYVNGVLQDVQTGSFEPNFEEPIYIGKKNSDEKRFWFHGVLDDIRIYDRSLTDDEVLELYAEQGYTGDPERTPAPPRTVRKAAAAKKWMNKPIRVRKTLEFRKIEWNDCYNSFALALYGVMRYSNKQISLAQALIYTGQGFAINTDTTVAPMDVLGDGSLLQEALRNLGFDMEVLAANMYGGDWEEDTVERALYMVRESIQRGFPVVGWNLDNYEHGLIYGYDDKRRVLNVQDINAQNGAELSYDDFGRRPLHGNPIDPEMFVLVLRERSETPHAHLSVTRYTEQEDANYRNTLKNALSLAARHIEGDGLTGDDGRKNGIAAIDAWIAAFETEAAHRFFTSYNLLWLTSTRQYLISFFTQSAITHCTGIQDHTLQHLMLEAADVYLSSYRTWVYLREMFPFPQGADTTDPRLKFEAIQLLKKARQAEATGLTVLRDIVGHLSGRHTETSPPITERTIG
ncbi:LamG domain-containing protein [Cohnella nanjingensis]|uniref:LamG domain-containing protein n=1 Tax=Cohnella nanjingensis TaxID=1387779 RepID=A0A7X0RN94_9BACL|nr:LamG domain-containing protein [Cohnella nanjingensis]MBB6670408.1 LamG domain-containing protein [Cohnella nanjingensis]